MVARRNGISLPVFNPISHSLAAIRFSEQLKRSSVSVRTRALFHINNFVTPNKITYLEHKIFRFA